MYSYSMFYYKIQKVTRFIYICENNCGKKLQLYNGVLADTIDEIS